jgi:hypothetical protein
MIILMEGPRLENWGLKPSTNILRHQTTFFGVKKIIYEVEVHVVPLDVCGAMFGIPYTYMRNIIFMRRVNQYRFIKDVKSVIINARMKVN